MTNDKMKMEYLIDETTFLAYRWAYFRKKIGVKSYTNVNELRTDFGKRFFFKLINYYYFTQNSGGYFVTYFRDL